MRVVLVILVVTALMLIFQTIVPVKTSRDMIFSYKHRLLLTEAETIASSLNSGPEISSSGAEEVMTVLGGTDLGLVVITDEAGNVLYSSNTSAVPEGYCAVFPEVVSALRGNDAFRSRYTGQSFESYGAIPVVAGGVITGCVYVMERDQEQAALLSEVEKNAVKMALVTVVISLVLYLVFGTVVMKKNQRLLESIRLVRAGDYAHRVEVRGHDEFSALANEFNTLTNRLQETEQMRRQFVSDASHELRTPLAAIRLLSDSIIQNDMDGETVKEFVQDISGEADRLTRMTTKLLSLTALDSRQFENPELEPVDLGACCKKAVRMLTPFAENIGAAIEQSSEEKCFVNAIEDDIFQLVLNLAENGIKYSQKNGLVRLIAYSQGDTAILIVEDNGVGIPEEELENIFQRFYRVDKARSREAGGTGLGLAIVRETVEKFGGTVTASNCPQGGARFTVKFPRFRWEGEP
ncbi:MAG: HAMP domain-containing sensor histidine kinase [Oscillospiraceae bacterium]|nr:HAMP domain-containing sensor histidine kinase [Oscillospiraceae bacterium]